MNLYKVTINIEEMDASLKEVEDMIECNNEIEAEMIMLNKYRAIMKQYHYNISVETELISPKE